MSRVVLELICERLFKVEQTMSGLASGLYPTYKGW
jgi:hypothetical protein